MSTGVINVDVQPGDLLRAVFEGIDNLFTSDEEKAQLKLEAIKADKAGNLAEFAEANKILLAQIKVNEIQAASSSFFDRGPRPFIMWVCGLAFALQYLVFPCANYVLGTLYMFGSFTLPEGVKPFIEVPFDMDVIMTVTLGLLGLGLAGMRSWEKGKGVAR